MFDKKTYIARRAQLKKDVKSGLIVFPANEEASANYAANTYPFRQDSNFLYFFGLQEPGMVGVIDVDADQDWIYADDLTMDDIIWMGHLPSVSEQAAKAGVQHTAPVKDLAELLHKAVLGHKRIHFVNPYRMHVAIKLSQWLAMPLGELSPANRTGGSSPQRSQSMTANA